MHVYLVLSRVSRELSVPCEYTEFHKQSVKINMEEKQRETCMSRELTVLCQYTEFQKQSVKIGTKDKHRETCMYTLIFKWSLTVPCQYNKFQKQSVKINVEEKQKFYSTDLFYLANREIWTIRQGEKRACLPRSFKREPRTNSNLPIHRISKAISENKHRG